MLVLNGVVPYFRVIKKLNLEDQLSKPFNRIQRKERKQMTNKPEVYGKKCFQLHGRNVFRSNLMKIC